MSHMETPQTGSLKDQARGGQTDSDKKSKTRRPASKSLPGLLNLHEYVFSSILTAQQQTLLSDNSA